MQNKPIKDEKGKGVYSGWRWLLWWEINPEELEGQVENYKTLKITKSARGLSFLLCILSAILSVIFVVFLNSDMTSLSDLFLFLILGFFMYRGHRWAMITSMLLWTYYKFSLIYSTATSGTSSNVGIGLIQQVIWWCLYMHAFYVALKVENLRRRTIRK